MTTPTPTLVERLRDESDYGVAALRREAAARIEELEGAIREELKRLEPFTDHAHNSGEPCHRPACVASARLNKALEGT